MAGLAYRLRSKLPRRKSKQVLLILDMFNGFDFPEAEQLYPAALRAARAIRNLKRRFTKHGLPVIYVNDHFGDWRLEPDVLVAKSTADDCRGREIAFMVMPDGDDYFVMKAKHSAFHSTNLDVLLQHLGAKTLILTGIAGNICVLFTAHEAYMRDFEIVIPKDCIASNTVAENQWALHHLKTVCGIATPMSGSLRMN